MSVKSAKKLTEPEGKTRGRATPLGAKPDAAGSILSDDFDPIAASVISEDEIAWDKSFTNTSEEDIEDLERIVLSRMARKRIRPLDFEGR